VRQVAVCERDHTLWAASCMFVPSWLRGLSVS
jgi:hypothetical protein